MLVLGGTLNAAEQPGVRVRFSLGSQPVTVTVAGKVVDAESGQPISGAKVRGHLLLWQVQDPETFARSPRNETQTDAAGNYRLEFTGSLTTSGPFKGKDALCVYASAADYETRPIYATSHVNAEKTAFSDFGFALRRGKLVQGAVVDEDGKPLAGAHVRVQNGLNGDWNFFGALGEARTDSNGHFQIWCSTEREIITTKPWLRIARPGYGMGFVWELLEKGDVGTVTVPRGGSIVGRVVDAVGSAVSDCEVLAYDTWPNQLGKAVTGADGRYRLDGLPDKAAVVDFFRRKNGREPPEELQRVTVYARMNPEQPLRGVPQAQVLVEKPESTAPDLVVAAEAGVSGRLIAAGSSYPLQGLLVRVDGSWNHMVESDAEGRFEIPFVSPGKHRLTAYLPHNLRGDRGIGRTEIEVETGKPATDVEIRLEPLAELRLQFVDLEGKPVAGITAGATWSKSGDGFWTEGTVSDDDGRAILYLYPGQVQYVRGFDHSERALVAETCEAITPKPNQVIDGVRLCMVRPASIQGRAVLKKMDAARPSDMIARIAYADGREELHAVRPEADGSFTIERLAPGVIELKLETRPAELAGEISQPVEIQPGETTSVGEIVVQPLRFQRVAGRLIPSSTLSKVEGLKIRVDLTEWEPMAPTDAEGRFALKVPQGKHRLTAYLPYNLRTDRGVGHIEIMVKDADLADVELPLETLAKVEMKIVDAAGNGIEGIAAAAWWTRDHSGVFTEGTASDAEGRAEIYIYPGQPQYLGAHDWSGRFRLKSDLPINLKPGEVLKGIVVEMVPGGQR